MTVSVIIPTYNRADTIGRAIESVLRQTRRPEEIVVVNDGSTDGTAEVLHRFGREITVLHQENRGPSAARNAGIRAARGDVISFLDSDDCWLPAKNERQLALLERNPGVRCCVCNAEMRHADGTVLTSFDIAGLRPRQPEGIWCNPAPILVTRFLLFNQVAAVRQELLKTGGLFNEQLRLLEDYELQLRLAVTGPWGYLSEPLVVWYGGAANSLSSGATEDQAQRGAYAILQEWSRAPREGCTFPARILKWRLWHLQQRLFASQLSQRGGLFSRLGATVLNRALQLGQAVYTRLPLYPRMITKAG